jgi:hypothetical protein
MRRRKEREGMAKTMCAIVADSVKDNGQVSNWWFTATKASYPPREQFLFGACEGERF